METVKKTDWTKIQTITVTLEEYKFVPDKMTFKIGQPYKLVLKNSGKEKHYYTSVDFFKSIALRKVQTKDGEVKANYLTAIEVYPDKEIEVFFVPIKAGNFELICTIEGHPEKGMIGKITIEDNDTRGKTYRSIY
jgi:uncharacterized cupredoxin-like copper-binding protein